jgi:uncharacterized protein YfaS (alpha-2-macroglobulin family)
MLTQKKRASYNSRLSKSYLAKAIPFVLIIVSLACSLPTQGTPTPVTQKTSPPPTATVAPTPTPLPLPPALVESNPPQSAEISLKGPITLYFNQPMQRSSVESAAMLLKPGDPHKVSTKTNWLDDATLQVIPDQPLAPETAINLSVSTGALSAGGLALTQPISLTYQTTGYLRLSQSLPEPGAQDVDPSSAVVAAFNRPVVPLGAEPATLPPAFTLSSGDAGNTALSPKGRGEWTNTSTYIFYPDPPLEGGKAYTVQITPGLQGTDGSPLAGPDTGASLANEWSFTTALPRLVSLEPSEDGQAVRLDAKFILTFSQPMDAASVEGNFSLTDSNGVPVQGKSAWNEQNTVFTFTPDALLQRDSLYRLVLKEQTLARGGTPLGNEYNASLHTVPNLDVAKSTPAPGGRLDQYASVTLNFAAPVQEKDVLKYILLTPTVSNLSPWWDEQNWALNLYGDFLPNTDYTLNISPDLADVWGGTLGREYSLNFRTAPLQAGLVVTTGSDVLFLTPQDTGFPVQATNLSNVPVSMGSVPVDDFLNMMGPNGYTIRQSYRPAGMRSWNQPLDLAPDVSQTVNLNLSPDQKSLAPGIYFMRLNLQNKSSTPGPLLIVVSDVQLTIKTSATEALVWAVDLRTNAPLPDATVTLYNDVGQPLATGQTDAQGIFHSNIPTLKDPYSPITAVIGEPGQQSFAAGLSTWNQGIAGWDFGISTDLGGPRLKAYLYTDRPVYRPGQTVYYRAVVRQAYNGRYTLPDMATLPITVTNGLGIPVSAIDLQLSAFGTGHGEYTLPADSQPGYYSLNSKATPYAFLTFQVANYRKPEINLSVAFTSDQTLAGQPLSATVNARYFFDAPAGNVPLHWILYAQPSYFSLPGYQVGVEDTRWLSAFYMPAFQFGTQVAEGDAKTGPDGKITLDMPAIDNPAVRPDARNQFTLEVTAKDENGLPVSARTELDVNPATFYIGLRPDAWVGRAGEQSSFDVQVVDWKKNPAGAHSLHAEFRKVVWVREEPPASLPYESPTFTPQYTSVSSSDFTTSDQGQSRLAFTPPEPGTYLLSVSGEGTSTELLLWVGGPGQAIWPNIPNQRLRLTADREAYKPGDTAQIFIPNPFGASGFALVTVERGTLLSQQVLTLEPGGSSFSLPLTAEHAPNVYVSVTLMGLDADGGPDFRQGYLDLPVAPVEQTLNVSVTGEPKKAGPGENVTLEITVTDSAGKPVEGEFSVAVVDLAALALADPNAPDITPAFYSEQPLGVNTGIALSAYANRRTYQRPGGGGGGGEASPPEVVRERFPDTAYWNGAIVTGSDGKAVITLPLPDTLTTWQVDVRGLTGDTRVGQARIQVITTKDLLVRPVTPRFLVAGDHVQLAAVVQNNTPNDLQVAVSLQAAGFSLDNPGSASQQINVPAQGRASLQWMGIAQDVKSADLVFSARSGDLQDAARPAQGLLPVRHYTASQTFNTSGVLDQAGERLELVSLPRSFDPSNGELKVELSPSLAAALTKSLDALEHAPYECTEQTLSRFLPNLETLRALQKLGIQTSDLQARLERTLATGLQSLIADQNTNGGWSWWQEGETDPYITAYVLFGLSRAREAGIKVDAAVIQRAVEYLQNYSWPVALKDTWQLDRFAFMQFALAQAGSGSLPQAEEIYNSRDQLSPWAQAVLALTLESLSPGSQPAETLFSDLQSKAVVSAAGAHWEAPQAGPQNMITTISNSAFVVYALAQHDPASPLVANAARFLMTNRQADGGWASTYATAWTVMALTEYAQGTNDLGGNFAFGATLNGAPMASGQAASPGQLSPVSASASMGSLFPDNPNALSIQREAGSGRLYYTASLNVSRPVEDVAPLEQGLSISRAFYPTGEACPNQDCAPIQSAQTGQRVSVRLTLTLPHDAYYLVVEDYIPAGAEILDTSLKTSQQGQGGEPVVQLPYDPRQPMAGGWGWWYFHIPQIYDDHIAWSADHLSAGTYELTYTLVILQPGEYRVLPARAWQFYFPDVQGNSAGAIFEIKP